MKSALSEKNEINQHKALLIFCLYFPSEAVCVCKQYTVNISYFKHVN